MHIGAGDSCEPRDRDPPGTATFADGFRNRRDIPRADVDRFGGFSGSICPCPSLRDPALRMPAAASLRLRICHDLFGTWSVHGLSPLPVAHLPSSFGGLRLMPVAKSGAAPATIELLIDGFYVLVHQEAGWPRPPLALKTEQRRFVGLSTIAASYNDASSVARSRSSWFIEWRDAATRLIASLASGLAVMKRSKSAFRSTSSRQ